MDRAKRFTTLEGMRGIAAICVVLGHAPDLFGIAAPHSSYLAVDFFFVLSGFVIAHVYAERLNRGMTATMFMQIRVMRLYPLYLLGTIIAVAIAGLSLLRHNDLLWTYTQPPVSLPFAVFMLPSPVSDELFPLNVPAWSLLLELIVNAAFAVPWLRSTRSLLLLMTISAVGLIIGATTTGRLDLGWDKTNITIGLARVFFSFPLGVLLYRFKARIEMPAAFSVVPAILLAALLFANPGAPYRVAFDLTFVMIASPALLVVAASSNPTWPKLRAAFLFLGTVSYPLYVLHHPVLMSLAGAITRHVPAGLATIAAAAGVLLVLVFTARLAEIPDAWVRSALTRRRRQTAVRIEVA